LQVFKIFVTTIESSFLFNKKILENIV